jgi:hypothetical protein
MTKAAAVITLIIALVAAGYLVYESTVVRTRYETAALACTNCTTVKEAAEANWRSVESSIATLQSKKKYREAEKLARDHAAEKPLNIDVPCLDCETPPPDYTRLGTVAVLGAILSAILFGAVKPGK